MPKRFQKIIVLFLFISCFSVLTSCQGKKEDKHSISQEIVKEEISTEEEEEWISLKVKASAYNSIESQTKKGNVGLAAWGDVLKPGMKAIAVSRDLIRKGLTHNTRVKIEGLEGVYLVKDKMHWRWKNKIDIYMGVDVQKARKWGVKTVNIQYAPAKASKP